MRRWIDERRATVNLGIELRVDEDYVAETNQRLALYRRVASATDDSELTSLCSTSSMTGTARFR